MEYILKIWSHLTNGVGCLLLIMILSMAGSSWGAEVVGDGSFNVRKFGAAGDGKQLDSPAINKAIDAAAEAGGGTVLVPAGTYLSGSIHLQSNIHLLIDAGATILGAPQELNAYDETEPWSGQSLSGRRALLFSQQPDLGRESYQCFHHRPWHRSMAAGWCQRRIAGPHVRVCILGGQSPSTPRSDYPPARLGNKAIALKLCRNVLIRDVTIFHGGHFAILVTGCDNLTVDNVTMDTDRDGIDIDCCRNTMVSNCRINSPNDDGLCPKEHLSRWAKSRLDGKSDASSTARSPALRKAR